jgi:type II secretory ATPase GspE/PulE/Tfp pilus assembly ATPase PilB-like protein
MPKDSVRGQITIPIDIVNDINNNVKNVSDFAVKIKNSLFLSPTELISVILYGSIILDSSDIHIEPEKEDIRLRVRIDGILHEVLKLEEKEYKTILSRIKLLSSLKLNITNKPQDGRFSIVAQNTLIEIRTSSLPSEYGETIVLRILNPKNLIEIEALGLRKDLVDILNKEINRPHGMIIVTGPTGSGKTTTLYAVLKRLNSPEIKIITIEDPIEYHIQGISQTQVDPSKGYTFASGLRSIVRQDPDVILVGEIRDKETAEIALQASLTGHLVLSTLHTNDAAGAVARLVDLGVETSSIAPALNIVIAQRLPRKVCKNCFRLEKPSEEEMLKIKTKLKNVKKDFLPPVFFEKDFKIPKAQGCENCNFTGYKGRIGIYEFFLVDDEIEKLIIKKPSMVEIRDKAIEKGMILMYQDGLIKVLEKTTTIEEIDRVVGE